MKEKWDLVYLKRFGGTWYPDEGVVRFVARYLQRRVGIDLYDVKRKIRKVLDAGCGNGRHVVFFAEQGFDVYGIDISEEAIKIANAWLTKKGLKAYLEVGDVEKLPFKDDYFDLVISCEVLDHIPFPKAKRAMREIRRVCVPGGYIFITLRSTEDSEFGRGKKVDHNTFVLQEGYEKGIIQHYFDLHEVRELFEGFKIFDIELYEQRFPRLFTVDKAFLQSSKGLKKHLDISKHVDLRLKYSRWYIAAEKGVN
jgi:ubiquinone/menaquinone biosynthesis C-methylase UbiE